MFLLIVFFRFTEVGRGILALVRGKPEGIVTGHAAPSNIADTIEINGSQYPVAKYDSVKNLPSGTWERLVWYIDAGYTKSVMMNGRRVSADLDDPYYWLGFRRVHKILNEGDVPPEKLEAEFQEGQAKYWKAMAKLYMRKWEAGAKPDSAQKAEVQQGKGVVDTSGNIDGSTRDTNLGEDLLKQLQGGQSAGQ